MNECVPDDDLCNRYKSLLKDSIAETPAIAMAKSTGFIDAVKAMPNNRRLNRYKRNLIDHLQKEWTEEAKRVHIKNLVKISQICEM